MTLRFADAAPTAYDYPLTIRQLLAASAVTAQSREIVYRDDARLTYAESFSRIGRVARVLADLGVAEGATVAVMDWDSHRYLECFFAVPMMGAVLQTVNIRLSESEIEYCLADAGASVLIAHRDFGDMALALANRLPGIRALIWIDDGAGEAPPQDCAGEYEALLDASQDAFAFRDFDERAVAALFYTTGTTGLPKGVAFTHRQIVLQALATAANFGTQQPFGFGRRDVYMPMTPMFHVLGWCMPYTATLLGLKQVYPGRYEPAKLLDLRDREKVSYSHCVPTIVQMLLDEADSRGSRLDGWTIAIGGSALAPALQKRGAAAGLRLFAGYGMSETCSTVILSRPRPGEEEGGTSLCLSGVPAPLVHVRVVDDAMCDVPHDGLSVGEIVLRAPWLTLAYSGNSAASEELWRGGWLHSQDLATIDADGYVCIVDRLKDVIKSGGEWISSIHLEELLLEHPQIREVAVIGMTDAKWGERPAAFVVTNAGVSIGREEVGAHLAPYIAAGRISGYARPDAVFAVAELPRTSVGKIDKKRLRAAACDSEGVSA